MKIELNFEKKHLYFGAILLIFFAGIILVKSYDPAQGWHSADQIASGTMTGPIGVTQGGGNIAMGDDGNPYLELRAVDGSGTPFIDLSNDASTNYDARLILTGDDGLRFEGANLEISGQGVGSGSALLISQNGGYVTLGDDNNPYVELRAQDGSGTPFIDFTNDALDDYDARLTLTGNDNLQLTGASLQVSETRLDRFTDLGTCNAANEGTIKYYKGPSSTSGKFYGCAQTSSIMWYWIELSNY